MSTERLKSETRKKQIAEAVLTLLGSQGVSSLTMQRVARLVGLSPSALYRHFSGKAEIIDAALDLLMEQFIEDMAEAKKSASNALDLMDRLLMLQVRRIIKYQAIPRLLFSDEINYSFKEQKTKMSAMLVGFIEEIKNVVILGQEQGVIRDDLDARTLAPMFLGVFQPSALMYHLTDGRFDIISQVASTWEVFKKAVSPGDM